LKLKHVAAAVGFLLFLWWALPFAVLGSVLLELDKRR
jgi:hypothetical protein